MLKSSQRQRHVSRCYSKPLVTHYDFVWQIDNFPIVSEMEQRIRSCCFPAQYNSNIKWFMTINPRNNRCYIPIYLNFSLSHPTSKVKATVKMSMIDNNNNRFNEMSYYPYFFSTDKPIMGLYDFLERDSVLNENYQLLKNNCLTIKCEVSCIIRTLTFYSRSSLLDQKCNLSQELGQLLRDQVLSDVTLCLDGKELAAHKAILAARSPIFAAMFRHRLEESTTARVVITDVSYEVMKQALNYIYTGSTGQLTVIAKDLLITADKYGIEDLKRACSMHLSRNLSVLNCTDILLLSDTHSALWLKDCAVDYIRSNINEVIGTDDWKVIVKTHQYLELEVLRSLINQ